MKLQLERLARNKADEKSLVLLGRLQGVNCLIAEEAGYHLRCLKELQRSQWFDITRGWLVHINLFQFTWKSNDLFITICKYLIYNMS